MLLLALSGLLLRLPTRQLFALLFQLPPRFTRFEPYGQNPERIAAVVTSLQRSRDFEVVSQQIVNYLTDILLGSGCCRKQGLAHIACQVHGNVQLVERTAELALLRVCEIVFLLHGFALSR